MAESSTQDDPRFERAIAEARERQSCGLRGREALARAAMAVVFLAMAAGVAVTLPAGRHPDWWWYPALIVGYAVVSSVHLEVGSGVALPTALVFVPMLFILPARDVPLAVAAGVLLETVPDVARGRLALGRAAVVPASGFFVLGPVLVFAAAGEPGPAGRGALVLLVAVAAQLAFDVASACALEWAALGVSPHELVKPLAWAFRMDVLLTPLAYGMALAARLEPAALLLPIPLLALLALFARERRERFDSLLELSTAYRGTAFLLGDVVEANDAYTGDHSRQVVDLTVAVCDEVGLPPRERRIAELTALLHDVGKIRIPAAIINKPGPLDPAERALIETHTMEGEALLRQVGGLLAEVGHVVRSCHERWDGGGYPDGLRGTAIPRAARIVSACDAYNAMTTDRPYRAAMSVPEALDELARNRGTQFDAAVVDALTAVVGRTASASVVPRAA